MSNTNPRTTWFQDTISLGSFPGQTVKVRFATITNSTLATLFYIDDTSLTGSGTSPLNLDFENGPGAGWTEHSSGGYEIIDANMPLTGVYSAHECGYNGCIESIEQPIIIPDSAILSYAWYVTSQEGLFGARDFLKVELYTPDGQYLATLRTRGSTARRNAWARDTISLSAWAGQRVILRFTGTTDAESPSTFFIDQVSIRQVQVEGLESIPAQ
jgi:hypothetical protein